MSECVTYTIENHAAIVVINRPKAFNALNQSVLESLYNIMCSLDTNPEVKVVIITGAGEKSFVAGADIAAMQKLTDTQAKAFSELGQKTMEKVSRMRPFVIAAVNGLPWEAAASWQWPVICGWHPVKQRWAFRKLHWELSRDSEELRDFQDL